MLVHLQMRMITPAGNTRPGSIISSSKSDDHLMVYAGRSIGLWAVGDKLWNTLRFRGSMPQWLLACLVNRVLPSVFVAAEDRNALHCRLKERRADL